MSARYFRPLYFPRCRGNISRMKKTTPSAAKLVVVIDDDALVLEATHGLLRSWGFKVIGARGFDEALRQLTQTRQRPDMIVCDYRLSRETNGLDVIEGLRHAFEIPAVLMSGDSSCPRCDNQCDGYQLLHKPVNVEALRAALVDAEIL